MNPQVKKLVNVDELQNWGKIVSELTRGERKYIFEQAVPLWIKRMISEGKLLLNPSIIKNLKLQNWVPTETQKKMIWASIVCKLDAPNQKAEKARIRELIKKRYDNKWWEDVYERAGQVWPAWDRYRKNILSLGSGTTMLALHSSALSQGLRDELESILNMVPEK